MRSAGHFTWLALAAATTLACRPSGPGITNADGACPSALQSSAAPRSVVPSATDPTAPVLAPGSERPTLNSRVFEDVTHTWSAAPFRSPSATRPRGSVLIAGRAASGQARLYEIDLATLKVVRDVQVPTSGSFVRAVASDRGAVVVVNEPDSDRDSGEPVYFLDTELVVQRTLRVEGSGTAATADGGFAAVATQLPDRKGGEIQVLELPTGTVVGSHRIREPLVDEWVPSAQVLLQDDTVWSLSRGEQSYVLRGFSRDSRQVVASTKLPGAASTRSGPGGHPGPHYGDGLLAPRPGGVLVLREDVIESYGSRLERGLPIVRRPKGIPAVDPTSGRVLLPTGELAAGLDAQREDPVVIFRRGVWRWSADGTTALEYDAPVAAFFVSGQGVIVTRNPALRVTVLEWTGAPAGGGKH